MKKKLTWKTKLLAAAIAFVMVFNTNALPLKSISLFGGSAEKEAPDATVLADSEYPPTDLEDIEIPAVSENPYKLEYFMDPFPVFNDDALYNMEGRGLTKRTNVITTYDIYDYMTPEGRSPYYTAAVTSWYHYLEEFAGDNISGSLPYREGKKTMMHSDLVLTNDILIFDLTARYGNDYIEEGSFKDLKSSYVEDRYSINKDQTYLRVGATIISGHGRISVNGKTNGYVASDEANEGEPIHIYIDIPLSQIYEWSSVLIDARSNNGNRDGIITDIYAVLVDFESPSLQSASVDMVVDEKTDRSELVVEMEFNEGLRFASDKENLDEDELWIELELVELDNGEKHTARLYLSNVDKTGKLTFRGDIGVFHYKNFRVNRISAVNLGLKYRWVKRAFVDLADEFYAGAYTKMDYDNGIITEDFYEIYSVITDKTTSVIDHAGNFINTDSIVNWQFGDQVYVSNSIDTREVRLFNEITLKNTEALAAGKKVEAELTDQFVGPTRSLTAYVYLKQKLTDDEASKLSITFNILDKNGEPLRAKATSWSEYKVDELYSHGATTGTLVIFSDIELEYGMTFAPGGDGSTVKITGLYDEIDGKTAYPYLPDSVTDIYADFDPPKVTVEKYAAYSNAEEGDGGDYYKVSVKIGVQDDDRLERYADLIGSKMFVQIAAGVDRETRVKYLFGSDPTPPESIDAYTGEARLNKNGYVDVGSDTLLNKHTERYLHLIFESKDVYLDDIFVNVHVEDSVGNLTATNPTGEIEYLIDGIAPTISYEYRSATAIDGNTKIEMKIGLSATDGNDVVQLLYCWGGNPDAENADPSLSWSPVVFERADRVTGEVKRVFGSELPESNTVYEETLWVKSVDEYGNESLPVAMPIAVSLEKPSTNMRFEGDYNALSRDHNVTVTGPAASTLDSLDAFTRVSITPLGVGDPNSTVSYVTLVKTGEEVNVLSFTGLTWYKVVKVGDTFVYVSEPETVGADYVLDQDSIMYDLFTHYGEIKISFENGFGSMTPVQGETASDSASAGSYYNDPNYLTLRFASRYDTEREIHTVDFGAIIDRNDNVVVKDADKGAAPYRYNADEKLVNPMRNTQIHFSISNVANPDFGMLDLDYESSFAELYRVGEDGGEDVLISSMIGFSAADAQYFTIFNTGDGGEYFVSGAYYLKVTVKSHGGHTSSFESSRLVLDAETAETSGVWQYSTQSFANLDSIISGEYSWSTYSADEKPFDSIGVSVTTGGEILRNRMFAAYSYGVNAISLILSAPDTEKTYEGITVGKVVGYRMWNLLSEPTESELEAKGFSMNRIGNYLSATNGFDAIYTEENIPGGADGLDELCLVKGVNTICYQVMMENGYVSPIRQFNLTVSEYTPELNIAIDSYQLSEMQSSNPEVINVDHVKYFIESAYSLNGSGNVDVELWSDYGMYVGIVGEGETERIFVPDPTEYYTGELGLAAVPGGKLKVGDFVELTENSYTSDFPTYTELCTAVFVARDEYGGVTIVAPQLGDTRRIENWGGSAYYNIYNINYYGSYYDNPYIVDDGKIDWRNVYNQPIYFGSRFLGFESYVERNNDLGGEVYRYITDGSASLEYNLFNIVTNDITWGDVDNVVSDEYSSVSYWNGENYDLLYWGGATITFTGGDLGDESVTLDLSSGNLLAEDGTVSDIPNEIGYMGADVYHNSLGMMFDFYVANPRANAENPAGKAVTREYVINCMSKYGDHYELRGTVDLKYIEYTATAVMQEYGAYLVLSFFMRDGEAIYRTGNFNAGDYVFTTTDYYGNTVELPYSISNDLDEGTSITLSEIKDTLGPVTVALSREDGKAIYVDITDYEIMSVDGNGTSSVTVTLADSTRFSYRYLDGSGDEVVSIVRVDNIKKPAPYVVWSYDERSLFEDDDGNYYRYGEVIAYLVDDNFSLVDSFTGKAPSFVFTPDGEKSYVFRGEEIKAFLGDSELTLEDDYLAKLAIGLYEYPDPLGFNTEDSENPNVQILAYSDQNGYYFNTELALRLETARDTSNLRKYSDYTTFSFAGARANAQKMLEAMGWGTAFRFEIQTEDRSKVRIFIKEGIYAEAPDYETGYSDPIPGIELNSKLLTVSANAEFSIFVVDSSNNSASIAFDINNIGEAPAPTVVKVEKGLGVIRGYLMPPEGVTDLEIVGGVDVKRDTDSPVESQYFGKYYVEYTKNDDYIVNYRFTYNGKRIEGSIDVSVTEIRLDEIALSDTNQPIWSENKAHEATPLNVTASASFTKDLYDIKVSGGYDSTKVSFYISGNLLTVTYSDNHPEMMVYCYDAAGNHVTLRLDAVDNIDKSAPEIREVSRELAANGRSILITFSSNERALFREGGYIGEQVTDKDGKTLYYYTRTVVENGKYSYSFADMSGLITRVEIEVTEIVSEELAVEYSTTLDGSSPVGDPSGLNVMIGDKIYVKPNRDATAEMSGGTVLELKKGVWNEITVPESLGGTLPFLVISDVYGNVLTHQFSAIKVPDTTPPEIIVAKKTFSVRVGTPRAEIEAELLKNFVAVDDSGDDITRSVKFTSNVDVVGITEVEYTATDSAGNSATVREKLRITSIYEPVVHYGETKIYRGEGVIVAAGEELILSINCNGAPYIVKIKSGNKTEAQMKDGGSYVSGYTTENEISLGELEKGLYTICIITQERDYFKIIVSVE